MPDAVNFTKYCFVSGQGGSEVGQLFSCRPEIFNKHVREMSEYLRDARVLAKLSEGDAIAIEVICYKNSLTNFYNKFKSKNNEKISVKELLVRTEVMHDGKTLIKHAGSL